MMTVMIIILNLTTVMMIFLDMMTVTMIILTFRAGPTAAPSLEQPLHLRLCLCPPPLSVNIDITLNIMIIIRHKKMMVMFTVPPTLVRYY